MSCQAFACQGRQHAVLARSREEEAAQGTRFSHTALFTVHGMQSFCREHVAKILRMEYGLFNYCIGEVPQSRVSSGITRELAKPYHSEKKPRCRLFRLHRPTWVIVVFAFQLLR